MPVKLIVIASEARQSMGRLDCRAASRLAMTDMKQCRLT
jgi:hypothetical protein